MHPLKIHNIDGEEFVETGIVTYKGKVYCELQNTNFLTYLYKYGTVVDGKFIPEQDEDIVYALLIMNAIDLIPDIPEFRLDEDDFIIKKGKLVIINKEKRAIYRKNTGWRFRVKESLWVAAACVAYAIYTVYAKIFRKDSF